MYELWDVEEVGWEMGTGDGDGAGTGVGGGTLGMVYSGDPRWCNCQLPALHFLPHFLYQLHNSLFYRHLGPLWVLKNHIQSKTG